MSAIDTPNDVIVLGAGIAGVSAAAHLLQRGQNVVLVEMLPLSRFSRIL